MVLLALTDNGQGVHARSVLALVADLLGGTINHLFPIDQ